ncbi:hypothetical protein KGQ71_01040 [Patescibacteria group bacterium]|nr:hypothetical protein [Patescibacteria group bacterium]
MSRYLISLLVILGGTVAFLAPALPASAAVFMAPSDQNSAVAVNHPVADDLYTAAQSVDVTAPVSGELIAAGNAVTIGTAPGRSIVAAGNTVSVESGSGYNAYLAGNTVTLSGVYNHDVYVAGNTVELRPDTVINGDLRVAGNQITLSGTVKGAVYAAGQNISSDAAIGGLMKAWDQSLTFSGGSVGGDLNYQSANTAAGLNTVKIAGKTTRTQPPANTHYSGRWWYFAAGGFLMSLLGAVALALALSLIFPRRIQSIQAEVRRDWGGAFLRGLAFLIVVPVAGVICMAIVVGWQIAIALGLAYLLALFLANSVGYILMGQWIVERLSHASQPLWYGGVVGAVIGRILLSIPVIGWLLGLAFFFGLVLPVVGGAMTAAKKMYESVNTI